ncbi:MAG: sugar transferase [Coleofasciculaceae cyanobacterium SM2_3_26]|nr:sugar transferase [Coleofasciculaceae cyanobacterium SM2_3_26]
MTTTPDFTSSIRVDTPSESDRLVQASPKRIHPSVESKVKRAIDILGAAVGLLITGVIAVPIAIAIQIDDPGSIFYSQIRCGLHGKRFRIWKFRSMVKNADKLKHQVQNQAKGFIFKNENDPRITRSGRFLRRTSLDEFPQFWNVLMGDMSLVGTRPPTPDEVEKYNAHHWQRLNVKPGMTGEWQVNGRSNVKDFEDIVKMDLQYQQKWSLSYDIQLIIKTVMVIFHKSGAC